MENFRNIFNLEGKRIVITGGLGILGRTFCHAFAQFGAEVAIFDLNESDCQKFSHELFELYGIRSIGVGVDVADEKSVINGLDIVIRDLGVPNVLFNNAATKTEKLEDFFKNFEEFTLEAWNKICDVNIDGMFLMAKHSIKAMLDHGISGSIIQTASIYGLVAPDQRIYEGSHYLGGAINTPAVYTTSKAAVIGLTKHLAALYGSKNIRVNTLIPGGVFSGQNDTFVQRYSARVPLGRMGTQKELVGALLFLASDASSYITGQQFVVDGGLTVW